MNKTIEVEILEETQEQIKILEERIVEESTEMILEMKIIAEIEAGNRSGEESFLETLIAGEMIGVQVIVGLDQ